MALPPIFEGRRQTVTQRGWYSPPYTACRFAVIAQIALRVGYNVDVSPQSPQNFVNALQTAGDRTKQNGSTMRQGQAAVRKLLPGAPIYFGWLTDEQVFQAVRDGATVGFAVNMGKLPRRLRNYCGYGYTGGHYMAIDQIHDDGDVALSDPMYRPARYAKPRRAAWSELSPGIYRDYAGRMAVTIGYAGTAALDAARDAAVLALAQASADRAAAEAAVIAAEDAEDAAQAAAEAADAALAAAQPLPVPLAGELG